MESGSEMKLIWEMHGLLVEMMMGDPTDVSIRKTCLEWMKQLTVTYVV